jgi:hypothetical protein
MDALAVMLTLTNVHPGPDKLCEFGAGVLCCWPIVRRN